MSIFYLSESSIYDYQKKIKSLNESQNIKEITITANIEQLLSVSKLNDYQNQLFKKYYKNIFNDMINYIYDYYHEDYISVEDKSLITKDNIKKNWVIYTITLQYDDSNKNEFGINISSDWNKKFLNTEYKKYMMIIYLVFVLCLEIINI